MPSYVGIDLGTTNSAICSFDGKNTRIWKSPEQNDVTPSAIYIDKRGNRYYGQKAYNQAAYNPANTATLFKRFIGTDAKLSFEDAGIEMSPEECSAEILRVLYGYLPEDIKGDPDSGTVITVPASFNLMKKEATMEAARLAGIGRVALMQEPVAAVMSILKGSPEDGLFMVYDLGGGTFDVSVAENIGGNVSLLAHGGIEMCGGRDIDRMLFDLVVLPWMRKQFSLPKDMSSEKKYAKLTRVAQWAAERAKIGLSFSESATIAMSEDEIRCEDLNGDEIYLDIELTRNQVDLLMNDLIGDTIRATKDTLAKAGLKAEDIRKIVFVGGPTNYKPLRDRVSASLGIPTNTDVNPMTAVAEGAAVFAESIDWESESHNRKAGTDSKQLEQGITLKYISRTPSESGKVIVLTDTDSEGFFVQFESTDTGWVSGKMPLVNKMSADLPLVSMGDNHFVAVVTDSSGNVCGEPQRMLITKTMASVGAIPASKSIGMEVMTKIGGESELVFLIEEGDSLPHKGVITVRAGKTIRSGSAEALNIKLWEGDLKHSVEDNRFIGVLKIKGKDIDAGMIPEGAEIECEYEITDSGQINLEASIPVIAATFRGHNLYSWQEGAGTPDKNEIAKAGRSILVSIMGILKHIAEPDLYAAKIKAASAANADLLADDDIEQIQKAAEDLNEARRVAGKYRKENRRLTQTSRLENYRRHYKAEIRDKAYEEERTEIENYFKLARESIERDGSMLEDILSDIWSMFGDIMWRQDSHVISIFRDYCSSESSYTDVEKYRELKEKGNAAIESGDIDELRYILNQMYRIRKHRSEESDITAVFDDANIIKG